MLYRNCIVWKNWERKYNVVGKSFFGALKMLSDSGLEGKYYVIDIFYILLPFQISYFEALNFWKKLGERYGRKGALKPGNKTIKLMRELCSTL